MKKIPILLVMAMAACNGSQNGTDGGADGDGGTPVYGDRGRCSDIHINIDSKFRSM